MKSTKYPRITVAVDMVLFSIINRELYILAGRRTEAPYKDRSSLPGSYVCEDESAEDACARKIKSIGLTPSYLEQLATFTDPYRDPRERIVSVAYYGLIPLPKEIPEGDDRIDNLRWISAERAGNFTWAFDHKKIACMALERLRSKIQYSPVSPHFLPKEFTISELAVVYEAILGRKIDVPNFRRDLTKQNLVVQIGTRRGRGPLARTYAWNWDNKNRFFLSLG